MRRDECSHTSFIFLTDIFHTWISTIYLLYLSDIWGVSRFDDYRQCCSDYSCPCLPCTRVSLAYREVGLWSHKLYRSLNLLDNVKPFSWSCFTNLHSHQQGLKFPITSDPCQHLELLHFLPIWWVYSPRNYTSVLNLLVWFKALQRQHENSSR